MNCLRAKSQPNAAANPVAAYKLVFYSTTDCRLKNSSYICINSNNNNLNMAGTV